MKVLHSPLKRAFIGTPQSGFCPDRWAMWRARVAPGPWHQEENCGSSRAATLISC